jgi:hypothetical protein
MKNVLFLSIIVFNLFVLRQEINAQPYKSIFGNTSTTWKIVATNLDVLKIDTVSAENDTTFNANNYKKIFSYYPTYIHYLSGYLREDTINGKVWYYSKNDNTEKLVMNLSLALGDSIYLDLWPDNGWVTVDSVYYNNNRKMIRLNTDFSSGWGEKLLFIEGIGTNRGVQYLSSNLNTSPYLLCSYQDYQLIYTNNNSNFNGCSLLNTNVNELQISDLSCSIFPNPTLSNAIIKFNNIANIHYILVLYNFSGFKIKEYETNSSSILIEGGEFKAGVYFYKLYNDINNKFCFGKIIFNNN